MPTNSAELNIDRGESATLSTVSLDQRPVLGSAARTEFNKLVEEISKNPLVAAYIEEVKKNGGKFPKSPTDLERQIVGEDSTRLSNLRMLSGHILRFEKNSTGLENSSISVRTAEMLEREQQKILKHANLLTTRLWPAPSERGLIRETMNLRKTYRSWAAGRAAEKDNLPQQEDSEISAALTRRARGSYHRLASRGGYARDFRRHERSAQSVEYWEDKTEAAMKSYFGDSLPKMKETTPLSRNGLGGVPPHVLGFARAIEKYFPEVFRIGGKEGRGWGDHPHGLAIDIMTGQYGKNGRPNGSNLGLIIAEFARHCGKHGLIPISYVIWNDGISSPTQNWKVRPYNWLKIYGPGANETKRHMDHPHISFFPA